jgi:hydrogenase/urease accessory protein HupE
LFSTVVATLALGAFGPRDVGAHEVRPGYLEVRERADGTYAVLWKQPARGEMRLKIDPVFPAGCSLGSGDAEMTGAALLSRATLRCEGGLGGERILIAGLETTLTDVVIRIYHADGRSETHLVRPTAPSVVVGSPSGFGARMATYVRLGIEHIVMGVDHLLFVLGLLLIVSSTSMLVKTITSFTLAHSITLAIATLGYAQAPLIPLNVAIALSILFLGPEIIRARTGQTSLTIRHPWIVAFAFGLLHGFGFASGLTSMGLPSNEVPLALLFFNVGVEIGQLLFVFLVLALARSFRTLEIRWPRWAQAIPAYTVGALGAFWTIERAMVFFQSLG